MKRPANNDADRYLQAALATLRAYGLDAAEVMAETRLHADEIDAVICAKTDGRKTRWAVDVKPRLTAAALARAIEQKNRWKHAVMFITDYVPRPTAERLRQNDIAFVAIFFHLGSASFHFTRDATILRAICSGGSFADELDCRNHPLIKVSPAHVSSRRCRNHLASWRSRR